MSSQFKNEMFWLENPSILIKNFCHFNPLSNGTFNNNMNAYTRFIIIIIIILFIVTKEPKYIYIGIFLILVIIIIYYLFKKDNFDILPTDFPFASNVSNVSNVSNNLLEEDMLPRRKSDYYNIQENINNPLKNIQLPELGKEPKYSKSTPSSSDTSKFVNGKIFQTAEQLIFDRNTIQFNTNANTSIPNDQEKFANWLYGTENICKTGSIYANRTGTPIESLSCNGFNVSTPTNFGNLNDYIPPSN